MGHDGAAALSWSMGACEHHKQGCAHGRCEDSVSLAGAVRPTWPPQMPAANGSTLRFRLISL